MVVNDDKDKKKGATNREYLRHRLKITKHLETKQAYGKNSRKQNASISQHSEQNFPLGAILTLEHETRLKVFKGSIITVTVTKDQMMDAIFHMPAVITRMRTQVYIFSATYIIDLGDDYLPSFSVAVVPENNEYAYNTRSASKLKPRQKLINC
ncbi:hypothetical protein ROZALSC1DRAFT_29027 [Rozella allomycis CSF55]|uniref:Uncharacterized protein n=1 Tax=Rozella allomycis (strain CSF55) TaxID=988480 RepID=A0A4P9YLH2_ROZAC|nr:hypothetical protein ROZALSC1DRAFT_29027 [Rozella allomycis CSF55]